MRKQVSASTPEAEYVALAYALKELLWLIQILTSWESKSNYQSAFTKTAKRVSPLQTTTCPKGEQGTFTSGTISIVTTPKMVQSSWSMYCQTKNMFVDILTPGEKRCSCQNANTNTCETKFSLTSPNLSVQIWLARYTDCILQSVTHILDPWPRPYEHTDPDPKWIYTCMRTDKHWGDRRHDHGQRLTRLYLVR